MAENSKIEWTDATWNPITGRKLDGVEWSQFPYSPTSAREVTE